MTNWRYLIPPDELETLLRIEEAYEEMLKGNCITMSASDFLKEIETW